MRRKSASSSAVFGFGGRNCSVEAMQRGKYYHAHQGRNAYLRMLAAYHDYEMEQEWIRALTRTGRVEDAEGCFSAPDE